MFARTFLFLKNFIETDFVHDTANIEFVRRRRRRAGRFILCLRADRSKSSNQPTIPPPVIITESSLSYDTLTTAKDYQLIGIERAAVARILNTKWPPE